MTNAQKTPLARTLPKFVRATALEEIIRRGVPLPGKVTAVSGPIVTVSFNVTGVTIPLTQMPIFGPEYIRYPVQVGDKGVAWAVPTYIGSVTGLGPNVNATISGPGGGTLQMVWFPVGNKNWSASPGGPAVLTLYGPEGVQLQDEAGNSICTVNPTGITLSGKSSVTITAGGVSITVNSSGVDIQGLEFFNHTHAPGTFTAGGDPVIGLSGPVSPT